MTQIAATDTAIVSLLDECGFPGVVVFSGPHEWDGNYVQKLLRSTPAIVVVFSGAEPYSDPSTELILDGRWTCYVVAGWNGRDEEARRLGAGAGHDLLHRAAAALHNAVLKEPNGDRLPITSVAGIEIVADAALDIANLWVAAVHVNVELPLPLLETDACYGPLDDFLSIRGTIDLPGGEPAPDIADAGTEGDVPFRQDLPQ